MPDVAGEGPLPNGRGSVTGGYGLSAGGRGLPARRGMDCACAGG